MFHNNRPDFSESSVRQYRESLCAYLREHSVLRGDFVLASGQKSNYYLDTRLTSLSAEGNALISYNMLAKIREMFTVDLVAGPALGACPIVTGISQMSYWTGDPLRSIYVRKQSKDHGTSKQIEGKLLPGDKVIMIEDVITTGSSVKNAIQAVRDAGGIVDNVLCLILRDPKGKESLEADMDLKVHYLFEGEEIVS